MPDNGEAPEYSPTAPLAPLVLTGSGLSCRQVWHLAHGQPVAVADASLGCVAASHEAAREVVASGRPVYGRTTGVGANRTVQLPGAAGSGTGPAREDAAREDAAREDAAREDAARAATPDDAALRLLRSHASGLGPRLPRATVRGLLAVRLNQLLAGGSGASTGLAEALRGLLERDELPEVHRHGSVGTGDLTALAEVALHLLGERTSSASAASFAAATLGRDDALPLLSSNALALTEAALAVTRLDALTHVAVEVAALGAFAARANTEAFDPRGTELAREGQSTAAVARALTELLGTETRPARIQDPFPFRCLPQSLGATTEVLAQLRVVVEDGLNAAAENPLVLATGSSPEVLHRGGFWAARLALSLDSAALAVASAAQLTLGRIALLLDPRASDLPAFLATGPEGSSGLMGVEYAAASALADLRAAATPATLQSVVLSHGLEPGATFAPLAAQQLARVADAWSLLLACELVVAVRAARLRARSPSRTAPDPLLAVLASAAVLPTETGDRDVAPDLALASGVVAQRAASYVTDQ